MTESVLTRTKKMLQERGEGLPLSQIARDTSVGLEWLKSLLYGRIVEPGATKLERVHDYLVEYRAAQRFKGRSSEARPS